MTGADQSRANVHLTLAIGDYDHTRDLVSGAVHVPGVDLTCMSFSIEETFSRFARYHEWDISEFSLAQYCALLARGDDWLTAIPVFPSRAFTHGTIFIRRDGPVDDPRALAGKRAGTPDWEDTGGIYTRGLLKQRYGLDLGEVEWFQACDAGDLSLWDMLAIGELDAVIGVRAPDEFESHDGSVIPLFSNPRREEEAYYGETGVFPIMHLVALRRDVYDSHPWLAMNLYSAFLKAKRRSVRRALETTASRYPLPWGAADARRAQRVFGGDLWPYGIDDNRATLAAFLEFAHEQGVCGARLTADELFPAEVRPAVRI